jgi:hypothetical protein
LILAVRQSGSQLRAFDRHVDFYLVLLRKRDRHPSPGEELLVLLGLGTAILLPGFLGREAASAASLDCPWPVWGSIAFIGIGMGALYLHLITFGTGRIGAPGHRCSSTPCRFSLRSSLFSFLGSAWQSSAPCS